MIICMLLLFYYHVQIQNTTYTHHHTWASKMSWAIGPGLINISVQCTGSMNLTVDQWILAEKKNLGSQSLYFLGPTFDLLWKFQSVQGSVNRSISDKPRILVALHHITVVHVFMFVIFYTCLLNLFLVMLPSKNKAYKFLIGHYIKYYIIRHI